MTQAGPPGAVFNGMVFLQAASRPGGPAARLFIEFVEAGRLALSVSDALAIAANADNLVTWDEDMLDLMQDQGFRTQYPRLVILNPVALLQALTPPAKPQP